MDQLQRVLNFVGFTKEKLEKDGDCIRIGVIGAAQVATYALIWPSYRRADVEVYSVAARDPERAREYAKQHRIPMVHDSYETLIQDPQIDAVYIGLPNGLHGEWSKKALEAGKHVLCEKPFTANADEAREVLDLALKKGLLCREAFHWREHPFAKRVMQLLQEGAIGQLQEVDAKLLMPAWLTGGDKSHIRFSGKLAGGTMMDAGCYPACALRFFTASQPTVVSASAKKMVTPFIDGHVVAELQWNHGKGLRGILEASHCNGWLLPIQTINLKGTKGCMEVEGYVMPSMGNSLRLRTKDEDGTEVVTTEHVYGNNESQYWYQLERFVEDVKILQGRETASKRSKDQVRCIMKAEAADSISNMRLIDEVYSAAGLPPRVPTCKWVEAMSKESVKAGEQ